MIRIYVPLNRAGLERTVASGALGPPPLTAYAVTAELRQEYGADADTEEMEHAAMSLAADASRESLDASHERDRRRIVAAADIPPTSLQPEPAGVGAVTVTAAVPWSDIVAFHVDTADDANDEEELAWFATQEAPDLLR